MYRGYQAARRRAGKVPALRTQRRSPPRGCQTSTISQLPASTRAPSPVTTFNYGLRPDSPAPVGRGAGAGAGTSQSHNLQQDFPDVSSNPQDMVVVRADFALSWLESCSPYSDSQFMAVLTPLINAQRETCSPGLTDSHVSGLARGIAKFTRNPKLMQELASIASTHTMNQPCPEGKTAARIAVEKCCPEQVKILVDRCPAAATDGEDTPLAVFAAEKGCLDCVQALVGDRVEVMRARCTEYGETVFLKAARCGHLSIVRWSLETFAEVEVDELNRARSTALNLAAMNGYPDIVAYLLEKGANKNAQNSWGYTPVISASDNGREDCLDKLLAERAFISSRLHSQRTAYLVAAMKGRVGCLTRLLKQCGGDPGSVCELVSAVDKDGNTAAHLAAGADQLDALKEVVRAGCPLGVPNNDGHTALDVAREHSVGGREFLRKCKGSSSLVGSASWRAAWPPIALMPEDEEEAMLSEDCDLDDNLVVASLTSPGASVRVVWGWSAGPGGPWRAYPLELSNSLELAHTRAQNILSKRRKSGSASGSQRGGTGSVAVQLGDSPRSLEVNGRVLRLVQGKTHMAKLTRREYTWFKLPVQWTRSRFTTTRACVALSKQLQVFTQDLLQFSIPNAVVLAVEEVRFYGQYQRFRSFTNRMMTDTGIMNVQRLWYGTGDRRAADVALTGYCERDQTRLGEAPTFTSRAVDSQADASDTTFVIQDRETSESSETSSSVKAKQLILADVCLGSQFIMRGAEDKISFADLHDFDSQRAVKGSVERHYVRSWLQFYPRFIITYRIKGAISPG